jgi:flagella basal body P-ring formation protein FlgA
MRHNLFRTPFAIIVALVALKTTYAGALELGGETSSRAQENPAKEENLGDIAEKYLEQLTQTLKAKGYRSSYQIGNIDPHFLQRECADKVKPALRRPVIQTESNTIYMKCNDPSWQIYIPVDIKLFGNAVVAASNIHKNSSIQEDQLRYSEIQLNKTRYGSYTDVSEVIGMRAKRTIRKDSVLKSSHLQPPMLVARGDEVIIVASNDQIAIRMKGKALSEGVFGEQISVKNLSSKRVIRARVVEKGKVSVIL